MNPVISKLAYGKFFRELAGTMNGLGRYAEIFVSTTEQLTGQTGLNELTMLPWKDFLPFNGQALLSRHPKWCPVCLDQQHYDAQGTVFPIAWALEPYQVCPEHDCSLEDRCPHCGKHQPFMPRFPDQGICEYCHSHLADIPPRENASTFQLWIANAIGDLIMRQSPPDFMPSLDHFRGFVKNQVQDLTGGNRAKFCRSIGLNARALNGWLGKAERPSFSQLLALSYGLDIMPVDIFSAERTSHTLRPLPAKIKDRAPTPKLSYQRKKDLEQILKTHVKDETSRSVMEIAKSLDLNPAALRYWFPDLCTKLSIQHKISVKTHSESRQTLQRQLTEGVVTMLLAEGRFPSRRQVNHVLERGHMSLAQPHVLEAYRSVLRKVKIAD